MTKTDKSVIISHLNYCLKARTSLKINKSNTIQFKYSILMANSHSKLPLTLLPSPPRMSQTMGLRSQKSEEVAIRIKIKIFKKVTAKIFSCFNLRKTTIIWNFNRLSAVDKNFSKNNINFPRIL